MHEVCRPRRVSDGDRRGEDLRAASGVGIALGHRGASELVEFVVPAYLRAADQGVAEQSWRS